MKRIIGVLFFVTLIVGVTNAQESAAVTQKQDSSLSNVQARLLNLSSQSGDKETISITSSSRSLVTQTNTQSPQQKIGTDIFPIEMVFKDGALYVPVLGVLMPVSGGGASGCFNLDLEKRKAKLEGLITRFPRRFFF